MFLNDIFNLLYTQSDWFLTLTLQHLEITLIAIVVAIVLGLIIGVIIAEYPKNKWILAVVNFVYTIPSIALFGFLIPICGIGDVNAIVALIIYALLPMVRGTHTGIVNIDPNIIEAAEGMGSTKNQILRKIKLPLARPEIMSSIRTMVVMTIALGGIAAFIGSGGLGVAIYQGITTNNITLTVAGSLLIAILALVVDYILSLVEKFVQYDRPKSQREMHFRGKILNKKVIATVIIIIIAIGGVSAVFYEQSQENTIHIASKSYTEEYVMGNILKELIEHDTGLNVDLQTGISGGTSSILPGMVKGDIDLYPEYTGVSWTQVLNRKSVYNETEFPILQNYYKTHYNQSYLGMYGFDDTYEIAVSNEVAQKYDLKTYSDLAKVSPEITFAAEPGFYQRSGDGYKDLCAKYGFNFKSTTNLDVGLKYDALQQGKVNCILIYTTDGRLQDTNLTILKDDKGFFPSYEAGTIVRDQTIQEHPELNKTLMKLNGKISADDISKMNYEVDVENKDPSTVAHEFLVRKGLI